MELFKLLGTIAINNQEANEQIDETSQKASGFSEKLATGVKTAAKWGTAIVGGTTAAVGGIMKFAQSSASAADNVDKMSQKIGISRQAYQELDFICSQSGTSVDGLQMGMKTLTSAMDGAANGTKANVEQFQRLGISVTNADGSLRSQEEVMWEVFNALQNMENQTEKSRLATELFGRSGTELMPLLNGASGSIDEMKNKAHELGLVMGDEAVDAGVELTDALDQTERQIKATKNELGSKFAPLITQKIIPGIQKLTKSIGENAGKLSKALAPAIDFIVDDLFPKLIDLLIFTAEHFKEIVTVVGLVVAAFNTLKVISIVSTAIQGATTAMGAFNAVMAANPIGAVVTAIVGLGTAILALTGTTSDESKAFDEFMEKDTAYWENSKKIWDEISSETQSRMSSMNEILKDTSGYVEATAQLDELEVNLKNITDESGRVIEGHENEANTIKTILKDAYGIEMEMRGNQIKNYENLIESIDDYKNKKLEEALLEKIDKSNTKAREEMAGATKTLSEAEKQLAEDRAELSRVSTETKSKQEQLIDAEEKLASARRLQAPTVMFLEDTVSELKDELGELALKEMDLGQKVNDSTSTYNKAKEAVRTYAATQQAYSEVTAVQLQGDINKIIETAQNYIMTEEIKTAAISKNCNSMKESYKELANDYSLQIESLKKASADYTDSEKAEIEEQIKDLEKRKYVATAMVLNQNSDILEIVKSSGNQIHWESLKNGQYLMDGISEGIDSRMASLKAKVESVGLKIPSYMKNVLGIHSPSKIMEDEVGQWIPAGVGVGIEKNEDQAIEPAKKMAEQVVVSSVNVSNSIPELEVQSQTTHSSFFENQNNSIINKFDELLMAIKGLKIVINSEALVGQIATDMDEALDVIAEGKMRGGRVAW